jgi:hypothetical protein
LSPKKTKNGSPNPGAKEPRASRDRTRKEVLRSYFKIDQVPTLLILALGGSLPEGMEARKCRTACDDARPLASSDS